MVMGESRIKVLEDGVEIRGKFFEFSDEWLTEPISFWLIHDIKLAEIPDNIVIRAYYGWTDEEEAEARKVYKEIDKLLPPVSPSDIIASKDSISIEIMERRKYWDGIIPLRKYMEILRETAKRLGFNVEDIGGWGDGEDDYFGLSIETEADTNLTILQATNSILKPLYQHARIAPLEEQMRNLLENAMKSIT